MSCFGLCFIHKPKPWVLFGTIICSIQHWGVYESLVKWTQIGRYSRDSDLRHETVGMYNQNKVLRYGGYKRIQIPHNWISFTWQTKMMVRFGEHPNCVRYKNEQYKNLFRFFCSERSSCLLKWLMEANGATKTYSSVARPYSLRVTIPFRQPGLACNLIKNNFLVMEEKVGIAIQYDNFICSGC